MTNYKITIIVEDSDEEFLASGRNTEMMIDTFNRMIHNIENNFPPRCEITLTLYENGEVSRKYCQNGLNKK